MRPSATRDLHSAILSSKFLPRPICSGMEHMPALTIWGFTFRQCKAAGLRLRPGTGILTYSFHSFRPLHSLPACTGSLRGPMERALSCSNEIKPVRQVGIIASLVTGRS